MKYQLILPFNLHHIGKLPAGYIIMLSGLSHREVGRLLVSQYSGPEGGVMELGLREHRPSPQQLRRAVMLPQ